MKYIRKSEQAALKQRIKDIILKLYQEEPHYADVALWNNIVERRVFTELGGKAAFGGDFPSNLYTIIREVLAKDKDIHAASGVAHEINVVNEGKKVKERIKYQLLNKGSWPVYLLFNSLYGYTHFDLKIDNEEAANDILSRMTIRAKSASSFDICIKFDSYCIKFRNASSFSVDTEERK